MAAAKFRVPTQEECEILRRNGIDPEGLAVRCRSESAIHLVRLNTRDEISLRQGDKPWERYGERREAGC